MPACSLSSATSTSFRTRPAAPRGHRTRLHSKPVDRSSLHRAPRRTRPAEPKVPAPDPFRGTPRSVPRRCGRSRPPTRSPSLRPGRTPPLRHPRAGPPCRRHRSRTGGPTGPIGDPARRTTRSGAGATGAWTPPGTATPQARRPPIRMPVDGAAGLSPGRRSTTRGATRAGLSRSPPAGSGWCPRRSGCSAPGVQQVAPSPLTWVYSGSSRPESTRFRQVVGMK